MPEEEVGKGEKRSAEEESSDDDFVGPPNPFFHDEPLVAPGGSSHPLLLL